MGDDCTPTTEQVRNNMALGVAFAVIANSEHREEWIAAAKDVDWPAPGLRESIKAQFDRWLAAHDEQVRQEAAAAERAKIAAAIEVARDQGAEDALRDAGRLCCNGAPDPYQEWYDRGVGQWLISLADQVRDRPEDVS